MRVVLGFAALFQYLTMSLFMVIDFITNVVVPAIELYLIPAIQTCIQWLSLISVYDVLHMKMLTAMLVIWNIVIFTFIIILSARKWAKQQEESDEIDLEKGDDILPQQLKVKTD
jgi:uncharacterized membrane protein (DUF4010 family)